MQYLSFIIMFTKLHNSCIIPHQEASYKYMYITMHQEYNEQMHEPPIKNWNCTNGWMDRWMGAHTVDSMHAYKTRNHSKTYYQKKSKAFYNSTSVPHAAIGGSCKYIQEICWQSMILNRKFFKRTTKWVSRKSMIEVKQ